MGYDLNAFPAPFLGGPLTGRDTPRNRTSLETAWGNAKAYGYIPRTSPDGSASYEVTGRHGEPLQVWYGYPGSEHLMAVHCVICGKDVEMYPSHMRRGASHTGCTARGKGARVAAVEKLTGRSIQAPGSQAYRNGHGGDLGQGAEAPAPVDATEATETADKARTEAVSDAAEDRPAPAPEAQPPKNAATGRPLGADQWRALNGMLNTSPGFAGLAAGVWDSSRPGWHLGSLSRTVQVMDSLAKRGDVAKNGARYVITDQGRAAHAATPNPDPVRKVPAAPLNRRAPLPKLTTGPARSAFADDLGDLFAEGFADGDR